MHRQQLERIQRTAEPLGLYVAKTGPARIEVFSRRTGRQILNWWLDSNRWSRGEHQSGVESSWRRVLDLAAKFDQLTQPRG